MKTIHRTIQDYGGHLTKISRQAKSKKNKLRPIHDIPRTKIFDK
jgi:hypothetical protein